MQSEELPKPLENFARGLMATTCLTLACGTSAVAGAITLTPGAQPTSPGTLLPAGTNIVNGWVGALPGEAGSFPIDWFEFQGLASTDNYTLTAAYNPLGGRPASGNGETGLSVSLFNNSAVPYFSGQSMEGAGAVLQLVPGDGFLEVEVVGGTNFGSGPVGSFYQVTLTDNGPSATPEPGTLATVGLALAGALAWSRKRRQTS
jgi:hypothetical protein